MVAAASDKPACEVTLAIYERLRLGMSDEEVARLVGCEPADTGVYILDDGGHPFVMDWKGKGGPDSSLSAQFTAKSVLIEKTQVGLR